MSPAVTRNGVAAPRPGREAVTGATTGATPGAESGARRAHRGEEAMVPEATFASYYGLPVINPPVWHSPEIPGYLFFGGLAGASSVLAAGASLTRRPHLARATKLGALGAIALSAAALVKDLGRPSRFYNMLRVLKPTSPMSVGSWLLSAYGPAAGVAALSDLSGIAPGVGLAATITAAVLGPGVASYTAALIADTAVPAWHEGHRELPFLFAGSAASAAAGLGLVAAPCRENTPARKLAVWGAATELAAANVMVHRLGLVAEPYRTGRAGGLMRAGEVLTLTGLVTALFARRSRAIAALSGGALLAASACTRFGVFEAGLASARDPKYTVIPQRERRARAGVGEQR